MSIKKLKSVKFANSIKIGQKELTFLTSDHYNIDLENLVLINIVEKTTKSSSSSSIFNMIWFTELEEKVNENNEVKSNNSGTAKAKAK